MELMLNELSISPKSSNRYDANDRMVQFVQTVKQAREKGFRKIRSHYQTNDIELSDGYSLYDWLNNREVSDVYRNFIYGTIILPFIKDEDVEIEDQFIEADFFFEDIAQGYHKTECLGLAAAYLYETLCISFASMPVWCRVKLPLLIERNQDLNRTHVFNVFAKESFDNVDLALYVENLGELELIETEISPNDKPIHLADHHGKLELKTLCDRLKQSVYIEEMRSANWGGKGFVRKVYPNGVIEIVLIKTTRKYALWIRSTGRNYRETLAIAEKLEERYS